MGRTRWKRVSDKKLSVKKRSLKVVAKEEGSSEFVDVKIESDLARAWRKTSGLEC